MSSLTSITICNGTKSIGTTFSNLSYLERLDLPQSITCLTSNALSNTALTSLELRGVQLNSKCFAGMNSLQKLTLSNCIYNATDLGLSSLANIEQINFMGLVNGRGLDNGQFIGKWLRNASSINKITFDDSISNITSLSSQAFLGITYLTAIDLGKSKITNIPAETFYGCNQLLSVFTPTSVTAYGENCFWSCNMLTVDYSNIVSCEFTGIDSLKASNVGSSIQIAGERAFQGLQLFDNGILRKNYALTCSNLYSIGASAFYNCGLTSIQLDKVTTIPDCCFYKTTGLVSCYIPNLYSIGASAFYNCGLTSIQLDKAQSIDNEAFNGTKIVSVKFNNGNLSVGSNAFANCNALTSLEFTKQPISNNISGAGWNCVVSVNLSTSTMSEYGVGDVNWHVLTSINAAYAKMMAYFFTGCSNSANTDVDFIFSDGKKLKYNITQNNYTCLSITNNILVSVLTGASDFSYWVENDRSLPNNVTAIQANAFNAVRNNAKLSTIDLNETIHVADGMLSGATYLTSIVGNKLSGVSNSMLSGASKLKSISFANAKSIGSCGFAYCSSLDSSQIDLKSLTSIGNQAFSHCTGITAVPNEVRLTEIGSQAFYSCSSLREVDLYVTTKLYSNSFANCGNLSLANWHFNTSESQTNMPSGMMSSWSSGLSIFCQSISQNSLLVKHGYDLNSLTSNFIDSIKFGAPKTGAKFFTTDNYFAYPTLIAASNAQLYVVREKSFNVGISNDKLTLISVDGRFVPHDKKLYATDFDGLSAINVDAFKTSNIEEMSIRWSLLHSVPDGAFSISNAPCLWKINVNALISNCGSDDQIIYAYNAKIGSGSNVELHFIDCYVKNGIIYRSNDPFIYNKDYVIVGVDEEKAKINWPNKVVPSILDVHKVISSNAFMHAQWISSIANFSNVSTLCAGAFHDNASIVDVCLKNNINRFNIDKGAFTKSGISSITVDVSSINGSTSISGYGLQDSPALQKVTYTSKVRAIAPSAFLDTAGPLTCICFSPSLTSIGSYAYAEMYERFPRLENVNFSDCTKLSVIQDYAFYNAIKDMPSSTLLLPSSLLSIGDAAFAYRDVAWTQSLSGLDQKPKMPYAYVGSLVAKNLKHIGASAFMNSTFSNVDYGTSLTSIGDYAFAYPKHKFTIKVPNSIYVAGKQTIGENAFKGNIILNPKSISKNIAEFDISISCLSTVLGHTLDSNNIASNVQGFTDATVLSATNGGDYYQSFAYVYDGKVNYCPQCLSIDLTAQALVRVDTSVLTAFVPSYLTCISSQAFMDCSSLTCVSAQSGLSIGPSAFMNCSSLVNIVSERSKDHSAYNQPLPYYLDGIIPDAAFYNCTKLSNILLLSSVQSIGASAFYNCASMKAFFDKDMLDQKAYWQLSAIGDNAFDSCSSLTAFDIPSTISSIGSNTFKSCHKLSNINIDVTYEQFMQIIGINSIGIAVSSTFGSINSDNASLYGSTRINFSDATYMNNGIIKIDNDFIEGCTQAYTQDGKERTALTAIKYLDFKIAAQEYLNLSAISKVRQFVFADNEKLRSISFLPSTDPENEYCLEEIEDFTFSGCKHLMSINGGTLSCKTIGCYAFANCEKLLHLQLSYKQLLNGSIGQGAFYGTSLNKLDIIDCPIDDGSSSYLNPIVSTIKKAMHYDMYKNQNPLELPDYCIVFFYDLDGKLVGKYDALMHDLMHASIDTNRNALTFVNKELDSITPMLLVKPVDGYLPAIAGNTFHANIVGRWK